MIMIPWRTEKAGFSQQKKQTQNQKQNHKKNNWTGENHQKKQEKRENNKKQKLHFPMRLFVLLFRCCGCLFFSFFISVFFLFLIFWFVFFVCSGLVKKNIFWKPSILCVAGVMTLWVAILATLYIPREWPRCQWLPCLQYHPGSAATGHGRSPEFASPPEDEHDPTSCSG